MNSQTKCNAVELGEEGFGWGFEAEALSGWMNSSGVSEGQFRQMREAGVTLVVPTSLHDSYPDAVKPHLISLESFIGDVRLLRA